LRYMVLAFLSQRRLACDDCHLPEYLSIIARHMPDCTRWTADVPTPPLCAHETCHFS
jgi:hypothetical protein